jgi:hypothetical protein
MDGVSGVKNFKYMCAGFLCLCVWSEQSEFMAAVMVFSLWIGRGFIFEFCS